MENDRSSDDENYGVPPKKMKTEWSKSYSNKAMQMMRKMGYEEDKGLGKLSQGRLEPVVAVQQGGRRGLGLVLDTVQSSAEQWNPDLEEIKLPEDIFWLNNNQTFDYDTDFMKNWIVRGERKTTIANEVTFCEPEILSHILESKTVFDQLNENDLRRARSRCNPFETIRSSIFLNRAAVKMANIDSMCGFMFTNPKDKLGNPLIKKDDLLYFADICAGPGGFTEYVLYKKNWEAKGFGFTLRGANDFKLDKFFAASPESFDPYYGVKDDGDIFDTANQDSFADYVLKHTKEGLHFVMADGGFSVEGQENIQEVLSKQLYLCQCLTALKILRENGSFVCKLFDIFTPFSVGLIYLMYMCFDQISIIKPNSSRPANSERYLVCKWKRADTSEVCSYLDYINELLNDGGDLDILEIVDLNVMKDDRHFMEYIKESNNAIGRNQIVGLRKIAAFCQNQQLKETRQAEFRKKCLNLWNLPDKLRKPPDVKITDALIEEILGDWYEDRKFLHSMPLELRSSAELHSNIESIYDWYFVPIGRVETILNACSMFLCKAKGNLLRFTDSKKWEPLEQKFDVAPKSLFYGQIIYEFSGEGRTQTRVCALHIIDAIMLGGIDVRRMRLADRVMMCKKYALSLNKPYKAESLSFSIRCKELHKLKDLKMFFNKMRHYILKDNSLRLGYSLSADKFFVPGGILIFCDICHSYFSQMSKKRNVLFYFDKTTRTSHYEEGMPSSMRNTLYASFRNSYSRRLLWKWTNIMQVEEQCKDRESGLLYRDDLQTFLLEKLNA